MWRLQLCFTLSASRRCHSWVFWGSFSCSEVELTWTYVILCHPQVFGICKFSQHHNHGRYFGTRVRCFLLNTATDTATVWLSISKLVKGRRKNLRERQTLPEKPKKKRNKKKQNSKHFMMWAFWVFYPCFSSDTIDDTETVEPGLRHLWALRRIQAWLGRLQLLRIALGKTWAMGAGGTWHPHGWEHHSVRHERMS